MSADAQRLAATALNMDYPDTALLTAVEATKLEQSPETYGGLLTLLARQPSVVHRVRTPNRATRIATAPDGATVFLGSRPAPGSTAVSTRTGQALGPCGHAPAGGRRLRVGGARTATGSSGTGDG